MRINSLHIAKKNQTQQRVWGNIKGKTCQASFEILSK